MAVFKYVKQETDILLVWWK